ncbi:hypothetical protein CYY_007012 [Polysphondylium violaceum]|uniref:Uncharacterized protein n=1 Tax=Polysphondylium violaceum TaxID=133409 RepID=A0A8J4PQ68_9MYCE|nr:hypothetical protein CYY_007012 [Polysphondylium violaceum]
MTDKPSNQILNHPDHMPNIFPGLKVIGPAVDDIPSFRAQHVNFDARGIPAQIRPLSAPVLQTTSYVKSAYQNCNFPLVKQIEQMASEDLNGVYQNIINNGFGAFQRVELDGKPFYATWSRGGMVWGYTEFIKPVNDDPNIKYEAQVQFGSYAETAMIAGIHSYNLRLPDLLVEGILAGLMVKVFAGYVAEGLSFVATAFAARLGLILAEWGIELAFALPEFVIPLVAACIVFTIVFVGLSYLWDWLNRKYTVRTQFFNWDPTQEWEIDGQYCNNAIIPGYDGGALKFNLPKMLPPGSTVTPPGWSGPVQALDAICFYGESIWNNDSLFLQGLSMCVRVRRNNTDDGFMWVYNNPRFSSNQQAILNGTNDPYTTYETCFRDNLWDQNPSQAAKVVSNTRNVIRYGMDYLNGAPDNLYNVIINIGPPNSAKL